MAEKGSPDLADQPEPNVDVIIRTFNSARTLEHCMKSILENIPRRKIIVVDHNSTDSTADIAREYGADIVTEDVGLGYATTLGISHSATDYILFVDSDIKIIRNDFLHEALVKLNAGKTGAVVGTAKGHPFLYGLPLGLTLFRRKDITGLKIPAETQGSETYHIRMEVRRRRMKVKYVKDAMIHNSVYRTFRYWPEWQGSQVRINSGIDPRELLYSFLVIFLILSNSKSLRNISYFPVFILKFLIGYSNPARWGNMNRSKLSPSAFHPNNLKYE